MGTRENCQIIVRYMRVENIQQPLQWNLVERVFDVFNQHNVAIGGDYLEFGNQGHSLQASQIVRAPDNLALPRQPQN
jgi:hypothetical protein